MARRTLVKANNGVVLAEYNEEISLHEALRRYADGIGAEEYVLVPSNFGPRMRVRGQLVRATYTTAEGKV